MSLSSIGWMAAAFVAAVALADAPAPSPPAAGGAGYAELVTFFREWRAFQKPKVVDGVPDYSPARDGRAAARARRRTSGVSRRSTRPGGRSRSRWTTTSCARR